MAHREDTVAQQLKFADATPSKAFFIDMLTRDITVADAILDLVDNAVDKAVEVDRIDVSGQLEGTPVQFVQPREIRVTVSETTFTIEDTCGGITLQEAEESVFLFGNPEERGADFGLSVYGIGMKRAFFKLGTRVQMESRTANDYWSVTWPISEWRAQHDWTVPIDRWESSEQATDAGWTKIDIR